MVSRVLITDDEERIIRNIKVIFDEMEKRPLSCWVSAGGRSGIDWKSTIITRLVRSR